jgi:hypothetical protein
MVIADGAVMDARPPTPDAAGQDAAPAQDATMPRLDAGLPDMGPDGGPQGCVIEDAIMAGGCGAAGCHAPPVQASLDLVAPDLARRLVLAPSHTPGCEGRVLIDPEAVDRSLLLQSIGAGTAPGGAADPCQPQMPPGGGGLDPAATACFRSWVEAVAAEHRDQNPPVVFEPASVEAAVRKVKTLLNGTAPTAEEVAAVAADPAALRGLVDGWAQGPAFERKLQDFLLVNLQQRLQAMEQGGQFDRFTQNRTQRDLLRRVMEESFVRTAQDIVQRGQPFSTVLRTRRWMMTTANLVLLRYTDQTEEDRAQTHQLLADPTDAPANLGAQVQQRRWPIVGLQADCVFPQQGMLSLLFGFVDARRYCRPRPENNIRLEDSVLTPADFEDWRPVNLVTPGQAPDDPILQFYDVPALRQAEQIVTRLPRIGFFTTSAFLSNWATNPDNQFRVTTNQAVLGALHIGFAASEPTEPLRADGLDAEHAQPETACYGCHRQLDPMRTYFARSYNIRYQRARDEEGADLLFRPLLPASFAFRGVQVDEGGLGRFASTLAEHPRFPIAWAQKLCLYANSARCDEQDPVFLALVDRFRDGLDLRELIVDLFSSPLVTGLEETQSWGAEGPLVSITRRAHLCALLDERTGREGICLNNRVRQVIGLIPQDDFARGAVDPSQPALPSAFHFAAAEAVCEAVARTVVIAAESPFSFRDVPQTLDNMVTQLMALPEGHPRHDAVRAALESHFDAAREQGFGVRDSARSAFSLACLSPDVMGVGL